ncbi:glycosyltransferase [Amorphus sp. 3PC139-8]|uniref:glycosyltransferase family protein n=1 Tax=Amorphus sp. 3PC139-8 TaxID=2735676 RepID=UPI00345C929D
MVIATDEPLRILVFANFDRRRRQTFYYNVEQKLYRGLIRLGHLVLGFSDRDTARELAPLPGKRWGVGRMHKRFLETVTHFRPHVVLMGHADLTGPEVFAAIRERAPGVRIARFCVDDPQVNKAAVASFARQAALADMGFITSAGSDALAEIVERPGSISYLPATMVDPAVETGRVFEVRAADLAWDGVFLGTGRLGRAAQLDYLKSHLPEGFRFEIGGRAATGVQLRSLEFYETLAKGAMSPCLPIDDRVPSLRYYASDRIGQLLGIGSATFTHAPAQFEDLLEDGAITFQGREDLAEAMARLWRDDAERRRRAEIGWRLARERTPNWRVARYLLEALFADGYSEFYEWPTEPLA